MTFSNSHLKFGIFSVLKQGNRIFSKMMHFLETPSQNRLEFSVLNGETGFLTIILPIFSKSVSSSCTFDFFCVANTNIRIFRIFVFVLGPLGFENFTPKLYEI